MYSSVPLSFLTLSVISMSLVGQLCLQIWEKWSYIGAVLWWPLSSGQREICCRFAPCVGCLAPLGYSDWCLLAGGQGPVLGLLGAGAVEV